LVEFFERSRDKWKEKCRKAKRKSKKLAERLKAARAQRDHWKAVAEQQAVPVSEPMGSKNASDHSSARRRQPCRSNA
jgi:hypothetical protein